MTSPPVVLSIPFRNPAAAFAPLAGQDMAILLDSALASAQGRFSYIAVDPFQVIRCSPYPWRVTIDGDTQDQDAFAALDAALKKFTIPPAPGPAPFMGGALGFFAYELGGILETTPKPKTIDCPADMVVGLYDTLAAFDLEKGEAWVIARDMPGVSGRQAATARAERLARTLGTAEVSPPSPITGQWRAETSREAHETSVAETIAAIHAGDIYQANITQRFVADIPSSVDSFALYLNLRAATPAPFAAFINAGGGFHIMSASPERFLRMGPEGTIETRPIKGTRPRGASSVEDAALAANLLTSAKDRAENLMIVDLLRNDLARVCVPGSVSVPVLCGLETFPAVHHLVSVVTGQRRAEANAVALLRAAFPGGSVTGAPKIKAMDVIHNHEPAARGPYCGTIAWLGFDGAMDSSIVIRTLVRHGNRLMAQAGGGIVAESDPAHEYDESVTKVKPLLGVLRS